MVKKNKVELKPTHGKGNSKQQEFMHLFLWDFTLLFMTWTIGKIQRADLTCHVIRKSLRLCCVVLTNQGLVFKFCRSHVARFL